MKEFDNSYITKDLTLIAGVDEAGRGPLAGPVVAASVIFAPDVFIEGVNDSKKLTEKERDSLYPEILSQCMAYGICAVSHGKIDEVNILRASLYAMSRAISRMKVPPDIILIDGNKVFDSTVPVYPVVHGDARSFAIAAASIVAKVTRDNIMKRLSARFPQYCWAKNKGYATKEHIAAIKEHGFSPLHRKTFIRKILAESENLFSVNNIDC